MATKTHSDRAMEAALKTLSGTTPRNAAVLLFIAAAHHMAKVVDDNSSAAELAYMLADEMATGVRK